MKPMMLFSIIALTMIVIATSFDLQIAPSEVIQIPANLMGQELYVCPAANNMWDSFSQSLHPFMRNITMIFFFVVMLLTFSWGWALYQNLLSDSFKRESFSKPWKFTKFTFWVAVIVVLLMFTPNHFRTVHVQGSDASWVLCESDTPGAKPVRAEAVYN